MIKIYVMDTCPDCTYVEKQIEATANMKLWISANT